MFLRFLSISFLFLFLVGCQSPIGKWFRAEKNVQEVKNQISKNEDIQVEKGKSYVWAADFSLSLDRTPSIYSQTAKSFTERGVLTLGSPPMEEVIVLREIVNNLNSTNKELALKGQQALSEKDEEIADLQNNNKKLGLKLEDNERKAAEVNAENAKYANTWKKITHGFWWIVWILGICLVLGFVAKFLPPPYNSIASIIAAPVGLFIKIIQGIAPSVKQFAGVVSAKTHEESNSTLEKLVLAIDNIKKSDPSTFAKIEPILKDKTNDEARAKILEIKKDYALV